MLQDQITESYCGIIFWDCVMELYYRIMLPSRTTRSYYGIMLRDYIKELSADISVDTSAEIFANRPDSKRKQAIYGAPMVLVQFS